MAQKTMVGARALVYVDDKLVGLFDSCQRGVNIGAEPIHLLGRMSPDEISITSYEAVQVSCSGFRVIDQGVHILPKAPKCQDLISFERIRLSVVDRQTGKEIMSVRNAVPTAWSDGDNAKGTSRIQITYLGTIMSDESGDQDEGPGAASLP